MVSSASIKDYRLVVFVNQPLHKLAEGGGKSNHVFHTYNPNHLSKTFKLAVLSTVLAMSTEDMPPAQNSKVLAIFFERNR